MAAVQVQLKNDVVDFFVVFDEMKLQAFLDEVSQFLHISLVLFRKHDASYVSTLGLYRNQSCDWSCDWNHLTSQVIM